MSKLHWTQLLCDVRFRESSSSNGIRNAFECDYDRLVYSSSVRRLQDKLC